MLPPSLYLAAPRTLALSTPHIAAAATVALAPCASQLSLALWRPPQRRHVQIRHHRSFYWWCRRNPARRYASWGRHNPIDGTEQQPFRATSKDANGEVVPDALERSPREKLWRAKMDVINRMMRTDPYEGLFGPSNRMLRGINWTEGGWRQVWEEHWKSMDRLDGEMQGRMRKMLAAFEQDVKYTDSEVATKSAEETNKASEDSAKLGWEYDAITNKMVQKKIVDSNPGMSMPGRKDEKRDGFVEIPVKPYLDRNAKVEYPLQGQGDETVEVLEEALTNTHKPTGPTEDLVKESVGGCVEQPLEKLGDAEATNASRSTNYDDSSSINQRPVPLESHDTAGSELVAEEIFASDVMAVKSRLPQHDIDLLTAEDVRARMGHIKSLSKESVKEKAEKRAQLEAKFGEVQAHSEEAVAKPTPHAQKEQQQWKLQREQLKEAAADFQLREKTIRKAIRELLQLHQTLHGKISGVIGRSNGYVRSGLLSPKRAVDLHATTAALEADSKVLSQASSLVVAAILKTPRPSQGPESVDFSLDRFAWDKKPFGKIRDAEELVQNVRGSLNNAAEAVTVAEAKLDANVKMAESLKSEVEGQKLAMRGHEEKWRWRQDGPAKPIQAKISTRSNDPELVNEIRDIYEDAYGSIHAKHRQNTRKEAADFEEEGLAAMHLGGIPEISPASFDGSHAFSSPTIAEAGSSSVQQTHPSPPPDVENSAMPAAALPEYINLTLDLRTGRVIKMQSLPTFEIFAQESMPVLEALKSLNQPALFLDHLFELSKQGFEPVHSSGGFLVLRRDRRVSSAEGTASQELASPTDEATGFDIPSQVPATGSKDATEAESASAPTASSAMAEGPFYSTKLQSPTSSTFQGLKPRRMEPVFSGEQGGHVNYERLRHRLRHQINHRRLHRRRYRRRLRRVAGTILTAAAACYLAGVVSETLREGNDGGDAAKQERDFVTGQYGKP